MCICTLIWLLTLQISNIYWENTCALHILGILHALISSNCLLDRMIKKTWVCKTYTSCPTTTYRWPSTIVGFLFSLMWVKPYSYALLLNIDNVIKETYFLFFQSKSLHEIVSLIHTSINPRIIITYRCMMKASCIPISLRCLIWSQMLVGNLFALT